MLQDIKKHNSIQVSSPRGIVFGLSEPELTLLPQEHSVCTTVVSVVRAVLLEKIIYHERYRRDFRYSQTTHQPLPLPQYRWIVRYGWVPVDALITPTFTLIQCQFSIQLHRDGELGDFGLTHKCLADQLLLTGNSSKKAVLDASDVMRVMYDGLDACSKRTHEKRSLWRKKRS